MLEQLKFLCPRLCQSVRIAYDLDLPSSRIKVSKPTRQKGKNGGTESLSKL